MSFKPDPLIDQEEPEQPGEFALLEDMREWGTVLPCEGGYLDQPWTLMQDLRTVRLAIQHRQAALAAKAEKQGEIDDLAAQARAMAGVYDPASAN